MPAPGLKVSTRTTFDDESEGGYDLEKQQARPTFLVVFFLSPMAATQTSSAQKMMGLIIILISLISLVKPSSGGCISAPAAWQK